jgi:hypothetical protein
MPYHFFARRARFATGAGIGRKQLAVREVPIMTPNLISRLRALTPAAVAVGLLALAAGAQGHATVMSFSFTNTLSDTATDDCRGGLAGTLTGTSTVAGQFEDTYPPRQGFNFHATESGTYRIDFVDGSYALGSFSNHFDGSGAFASTSTVLDKSTVYTASAELLGTEVIHVVDHITVKDLPPLGPSDNDVVEVTFDKLRLTCSL